MFESDPFSGIEDLFNQLSQGRMHSTSNYSQQSQSLLSTIEAKNKTYLIFDFSGKELEDVKISKNESSGYLSSEGINQKFLNIKLKNSMEMKFELPGSLSKKAMEYTFKNGILEVSFKK